MSHPFISVVMSVYDGESYLREAINSILWQTYRNFEFIIVNDGSTDFTLDILRSYDDDRIVIINKNNTGLSDSLNRGIAVAQGKYIARQDADDISISERLSKQVAFMEINPTVGLLSSWFEFIDETGKKLGQCNLAVDNDTIKVRLPKINQFCHGASLIRKAALDTVGAYREFFQYAQDYDLWLRISEKYDLHNLPEKLYLYRQRDNAIFSEKLIIQSRFAGLAAKMAKQRIRSCMDDIAQGKAPLLPEIGELTEELRSYIAKSLANKSL